MKAFHDEKKLEMVEWKKCDLFSDMLSFLRNRANTRKLLKLSRDPWSVLQLYQTLRRSEPLSVPITRQDQKWSINIYEVWNTRFFVSPYRRQMYRSAFQTSFARHVFGDTFKNLIVLLSSSKKQNKNKTRKHFKNWHFLLWLIRFTYWFE